MSDRRMLLGKRGKQEEEGFKALFREHFASMCVFADRYLNDGEMARDVVHDVFCRLWENLSELDGVTNVRNYLYTTVKNRCLDLLRRESVRLRYEERQLLEMKAEEAFFEGEVLREDLYRMLDEAIQILPARSREILLLKLQGLKNQEIAEKMGVSVNTINTLKMNAYKVIRDSLQDQYLLCLLFFLLKSRI